MIISKNSIATKYIFSFLRLSTFLFLSLISLNTFAQKQKVDDLTDEQVAAFLQKAKASGMSEAQIEKAASLQGYSPADIAKMRERLNSISNEKGKKTNESDVVDVRKATQTAVYSDSSALKADVKEVAKKSQVFGMSMFAAGGLSFEPNLRIATPKNYQLGPDDELNIDIFGNALDNYKVKVSPEGTIRILN